MKKFFLVLAILAVCVFGFCGIATAADPESYFTVDSTGAITAYSGPGGLVNIPETVNGVTVTQIKVAMSTATEVFIPKTVTRVEKNTLYNTKIVWFDSKTATIDTNAFVFFGSSKLEKIIGHAGSTAETFAASKSKPFISFESMFAYSNGEVTGYIGTEPLVFVPSELGDIPVTAIGNSAFAGTNVTRVVLSSSVQYINNNAFENCFTLTTVDMTKDMASVSSMGTGVFSGSALANITFNTLITTIPDTTFLSTQLSSIKIPDNITTIGLGAFANNANLTKVIIPDSVTTLGPYAFYACPNLSDVKLNNNLQVLDTGTFQYTGITSIDIPKGVSEIKNDVFADCNGLTDIYIYNYDLIIQDDTSIPEQTEIHGFTGSTSEAYANQYNRVFVPFTSPGQLSDYYNYTEYELDPTSLNYSGTFTASGTRSYSVTCTSSDPIIIKAYPDRFVFPGTELIFSGSTGVTLDTYYLGTRVQNSVRDRLPAVIEGNNIIIPEVTIFPSADADHYSFGKQVEFGQVIKVAYNSTKESQTVNIYPLTMYLPPYNNQINITTLGQTSVMLKVDFHGMPTKDAEYNDPLAKLQRSTDLINWVDICDFVFVEGPETFTDHGLLPDTTYYYRALYAYSKLKQTAGTYQGGKDYVTVHTSEDFAVIYAQQALAAAEAAAANAENTSQLTEITAERTSEVKTIVQQMQEDLSDYESSLTPTIISLQANNNATATKNSTIQITANATNARYYRIGKGSTFNEWQTSPTLTSPTLSMGPNTLIVEAKRTASGAVTRATIVIFRI